jgi:hypothetical protein
MTTTQRQTRSDKVPENETPQIPACPAKIGKKKSAAAGFCWYDLQWDTLSVGLTLMRNESLHPNESPGLQWHTSSRTNHLIHSNSLVRHFGHTLTN